MHATTQRASDEQTTNRPHDEHTTSARRSRRIGTALWSVQVPLALLFLFAGAMKLVTPADVLAQQASLPGAFMQFIGVAEVLGALGLVLPGLARIRTELTPLAATGLVLVMIGAVTVTLARGGGTQAVVPAVVGLLAAFVAYGRWRLAPVTARRSPRRPRHAATVIHVAR